MMGNWVFGTWATTLVVPASTLDAAKTGANLTLSNGNLTATNGAAATWSSSIGTLSHSTTGKFYFEATIVIDVSGNMVIGLMDTTIEAWNAYFIGQDTHSWGYVGSTGQTVHNTAFTAFGATYAAGDIIGVAWDAAAGNVWFAKNNAYQASGNPAAGTNPALTGLPATLFPGISLFDNTNQTTVAFGSGNSFAPPAGFSLWG